MLLKQFSQQALPVIEEELRQAVALARGDGLDLMYAMLAYHMGWEGQGAGAGATGKRIRPLLVLLCAASCGGEWRAALPAAVAVELVHNFSLVHDDIEDHSPLRRGRPTVWAQWGVPQAINVGDALFTLAYLALNRLEETTSPAIALQAGRILQAACLRLTQGQYLDLAFEQRTDLTLDAYWTMVGGKTAALLAACTELGALAGGASAAVRQAYHDFGWSLGLAFQAQDDLLGIWGDAVLTGKSTESDLAVGKKSLPVVYALNQQGEFVLRWAQGPVTPGEVPALAALLEQEGARTYTQEAANRLITEALMALDQAAPNGETGLALRELAQQILMRTH